MHWRRIAPVQEVGAQIICGSGAVARVTERLAGKSRLFDDLRVDHGEDWIAIFAASLIAERHPPELFLPNLGGVALYEEAPGWWLPVGVEFAAPAIARGAMRDALLTAYSVRAPVILVPRFDDAATITDHADLYAIGELKPYRAWRIAA
jgi:hypothetical protein